MKKTVDAYYLFPNTPNPFRDCQWIDIPVFQRLRALRLLLNISLAENLQLHKMIDAIPNDTIWEGSFWRDSGDRTYWYFVSPTDASNFLLLRDYQKERRFELLANDYESFTHQMNVFQSESPGMVDFLRSRAEEAMVVINLRAKRDKKLKVDARRNRRLLNDASNFLVACGEIGEQRSSRRKRVDYTFKEYESEICRAIRRQEKATAEPLSEVNDDHSYDITSDVQSYQEYREELNEGEAGRDLYEHNTGVVQSGTVWGELMASVDDRPIDPEPEPLNVDQDRDSQIADFSPMLHHVESTEDEECTAPSPPLCSQTISPKPS